MPDEVSEFRQVVYPSIGRRYGASVLDGFVVLAGMLAIGTTLGDVGPALVPLRVALFIALVLGYEPLGTALGATLGQRAFGFRIRRASDHARRLAVPAALVRYVVKVALGVFSFLLIAVSSERRALHDLASGSIVLDAADAA